MTLGTKPSPMWHNAARHKKLPGYISGTRVNRLHSSICGAAEFVTRDRGDNPRYVLCLRRRLLFCLPSKISLIRIRLLSKLIYSKFFSLWFSLLTSGSLGRVWATLILLPFKRFPKGEQKISFDKLFLCLEIIIMECKFFWFQLSMSPDHPFDWFIGERFVFHLVWRGKRLAFFGRQLNYLRFYPMPLISIQYKILPSFFRLSFSIFSHCWLQCLHERPSNVLFTDFTALKASLCPRSGDVV